MARELKDLNLTDNFLFGALMSDEEAGPILAETILSTIFQREFQELKVHSEHVIWPESEKLHGVRLDAYIEENSAEIVSGNGGIYDIEPDKKKGRKQNLPRRARFYHSKVDGAQLESGKKYDTLKNVWIIFITTFDPFDENRMVYTIKNRCLESPDLSYEDGAATLFLNTKGTEGDIPEDLRDLMRYLNQTVPENAVTEKLEKVQKIVEQKKLDPKVRGDFMTWEEYLEEEREEAREEVREEAQKEVEQKVEAAEQKAEAAEQKAEAAEQKAEVAEQKAEAAEQKAEVAEQKVEAAEKKAEASEQKAEAEKQKAETAERKLAEAQEEIRQLKEQLMKYR